MADAEKMFVGLNQRIIEQNGELRHLRRMLDTVLLALTQGDKEVFKILHEGGAPEPKGQLLERLDALLRRRIDLPLQQALDVAQLVEPILESVVTVDETGIDSPRSRFLAMEVFADDYDEGFLAAITDLASSLGFEVVAHGPVHRGSIRKRWFLRTRKTITTGELAEHYELLKRAVELHHLDQTQADVDTKYARMAAEIVGALDQARSLALKIGALLVVKHTDDDDAAHVAVVTLTARQLLALQTHPEVLAEPAKTLSLLAAIAGDRVEALPLD